LIDVFGKWKEEHMTDMGIGIAHMNKEEKLQKAIKKMQGFSSFSVVAKYHDNSNQANPITIIQYRIDAENERQQWKYLQLRIQQLIVGK
jgi:type III secretory pathway lipoprotein EscJ